MKKILVWLMVLAMGLVGCAEEANIAEDGVWL